MRAKVPDPGPTCSRIRRRTDAGDRSTGLVRLILWTALGVGVLAGLVETCWSYLLPTLSEDWQAALPTTTTALLMFCAAAVATDGLLVLAGGVLLLIVLAGSARALGVRSGSRNLRIIARAAILGGTLCYLFNGWAALYVLSCADQPTRVQRVAVAAGTIGLILLAWVACVRLERAKERGRGLRPIAAWGISVMALLALTATPFLRHRAREARGVDLVATDRGARPNIVLVTFDTLRHDYLGCYGHPWIETPTLDALAADGVVFDAAISQAPSTTPSHCSIMTSVYPFEHGAENGRPMKPELVTLAEVLRAVGYETVAFTSATTTRSINTGLQRGFERYVDSLVSWSELFGRDEFQHLVFFYLAGFTQDTQIAGEVVTDRVLRWLRKRRERPFFAWLHYFDPHEPYGSPPPFHDMYKGRVADGLPMAEQRERYAEDITSADFQLGRFIAALRHSGHYDDTLIIVTSDHGEAFGEAHARIVETGHGHYLSDVTQRVPLIVKPAHTRPASRHVSEQIELIDLAPTILGLLGIDPPAGFRGRSYARLLEGRPSSPVERYARAFNVVHVEGSDGEVLYLQQLAVRSSRWKYIARPRLAEAELYDLRNDPLERRSVADEHPELTDELWAQIESFWNPEHGDLRDPRKRMTATLVRQLRALGYLGGEDGE